MSQSREDRTNRATSNELSKKQWGLVTSVAAAATLGGGPVAGAGAAVGTAGGLYLSNALGWTDDE